MVKGLGQTQIAAKKQTDNEILSFIEKNRGTYSREIIRKTGKSPNTVNNSIRRLLESKKIISLKDSDLFPKLKRDAKKDTRIKYVCFNPKLERETKKLKKSLEKKKGISVSGLKKLQEADRKFFRPRLNEHAEIIEKTLHLNHQKSIMEIRRSLKISNAKINVSMIGIHLYRLLEKIELEKNDSPWAPKFYLDLLPKKYTHLRFDKFSELEEFWEKNEDLNGEPIYYDVKFAENYIKYKESIPSIEKKGRFESYTFPQNFLRYNKKLIQKLKSEELKKNHHKVS